jgi:DNA-binding GntR family transcriptional regulator
MKQLLLDGGFAPGEQLTEIALSKKLGVSRGTVREASRMLLQDGLLVSKGVHVFVFEPTLQDVDDLYQCRENLESLAAKLAAELITKEKEESLLDIVAQTREALARGETEEVVRLNTSFHDTILQLSNNKQLIRFMDLIRSKTVYMRNSTVKSYFRDQCFVDEHGKIAVAIAGKDGIQAEQEMKNHIQNDLKAFHTLYKNKISQNEDEVL